MNILLAILLGGFFGYALYKSGAANPKKIISMLRLEDFNLMKVILFGIGLSSALIALAHGIGIFNISHLSIKSLNLGVVLGGIIFGIGFGTVGTCPGTCVAAAGGVNLKQALGAILGGIFSALAFSLSFEWLDGIGLFSSFDYGRLTFFNLSERYPSILTFGFTGLLLSGILFMVIAWVLPQRLSSKTTIEGRPIREGGNNANI